MTINNKKKIQACNWNEKSKNFYDDFNCFSQNFYFTGWIVKKWFTTLLILVGKNININWKCILLRIGKKKFLDPKFKSIT